ncbi:hypothetical protein ACFV3R_12315 [Streptomyces sp. NPDC059740]|uniref:hypothetical protein n=1 Tax=Streptomyces sp. NPDC059740 TaxID=3346926 RepID=UPI00365BD039
MPAYDIDQVLADAHIPDAFADYDLEASKRAITAEVSGALCRSGRAAGCSPALHDRLTADLYALSAQALHRSDAPQRLARLVNNRRIDPDGALHFACLLNLADYPDAAQFWWQFAAGAGNATAAHLLSLLHLRRGEYRDAEHWADQADELADTSCGRRPTYRRPESALVEPPRPNKNLKAAIAHLTIDEDEEFGPVPHPDPKLAERIEELAEAL